jgi:phosphatidate cytidylyltransferase
MKRVLTAAVLIPVVLLVVFKAPLWLFALAVAGIIVLALHEYLNLAEVAGYKPFHFMTYFAALFPILLALSLEFYASVSAAGSRLEMLYLSQRVGLGVGLLTIAALAVPALGIPLVFRQDMKMGMGSAATSLAGALYIGASLSCLIWLRTEADNFLIVFILASVWAGDIAAYYVGRSIGRHKLAPVVSPNKSWEGAIASIVASVAVAILVFHYGSQIDRLFAPSGTKLYWLVPRANLPFLPAPLAQVMVLGIITNAAAQFGDLFESALKRGANMKDSGTLLPGHGGILDRIDALLFAIPVVWYYATLTQFLLPKF